MKLKYPCAEIIDSFITKAPPKDSNIPVWYLHKSIELLAQADMAVFAFDWHNARGCVIEHHVAIAYGIPVLEVNLP